MLKFMMALIAFQTATADEILITTRNIKKGEIITKNDFAVEFIQKAHQNSLSEIEIQENFRAAKNLAKGKPLKKNDIYIDSAIVHKGDVVSATFIKKNLSIEFQAIALSDGKLNDIIKIKNIDTKKILTGKVMENGTIFIS